MFDDEFIGKKKKWGKLLKYSFYFNRVTAVTTGFTIQIYRSSEMNEFKCLQILNFVYLSLLGGTGTVVIIKR